MNRKSKIILPMTLVILGTAGFTHIASSAELIDPAKAAIISKEASARSQAWRASKAQAGPTSRDIITARTAGYVPLRQGPFPLTEFQVTGLWQAEVDGSWLLVYIGASRNPSDGTETQSVRLYAEPVLAGGSNDRMRYLSQVSRNRPGALRFQSQTAGTLLFTDGSGESVRFDLSTRAFLN